MSFGDERYPDLEEPPVGAPDDVVRAYVQRRTVDACARAKRTNDPADIAIAAFWLDRAKPDGTIADADVTRKALARLHELGIEVPQ